MLSEGPGLTSRRGLAELRKQPSLALPLPLWGGVFYLCVTVVRICDKWSATSVCWQRAGLRRPHTEHKGTFTLRVSPQ